MSEWSKSQENIFKKDSVIEECLASPVQRERVDIALRMIGGPNLKVLDVGCGDGAISELIHNNGNECYGMDLPEVLGTVPEKRKEWFHTFPGDASVEPWGFVEYKPPRPDGNGIIVTGTTIPKEWADEVDEVEGVLYWKSNFFDVVFMGEILEHFIDIEVPLKEAWRVLKTDGRLVLTTPNAVRALNRIAMLQGVIETWHEWRKIPHHVRYFTPQTIQEAVTKYGFQPEEISFGRSQAEGSDRGFSDSWLEVLTPEERRVIVRLIDRFSPSPIWKHSIIVLGCRKRGEVRPKMVGFER